MVGKIHPGPVSSFPGVFVSWLRAVDGARVGFCVGGGLFVELAAGRGVVVALGWTTDVHIDRVGIAVRVAVAASSPLSPLEPKPREARQAASTPAVFIP